MKTKVQKREEINKAEKMLQGSNAMVFVNFNKVSAEDVRKLRRQVSASGGSTVVIKKRLLNVLFKEKGIDMDVRQYDSSVGAIFSPNSMEDASSPVYKFFAELGGTDKEAKAEAMKKILGGYDLSSKIAVDSKTVIYYGQLPPREVALTMVLGMLVAPLRGFMHVVNEKSKQA
jgi:ribosomal protein L10